MLSREKIYKILIGLLIVTTSFGQVVIPAKIIVKEGDNIAGSIITNVYNPVSNELEQVGFAFRMSNLNYGMWYGYGPIHTHASDPALSGIEHYSGIGNNGNFIFSSSYLGNDAVYDQNGLITYKTEQANGFDMGVTTTFHSRPFMIGKDVAYWIAGLNFSRGTSTEERALYTMSDGGLPTPVYHSSGSSVGGFLINSLDFDFYVSDNNEHLIQVLSLNTGSGANDSVIALNGDTILVREGFPSSRQGHEWGHFDFVRVNNNGDYLFSGDTDGPNISDEFIALNGSIVIFEGDVLNGIPLTTFFVKNISINDFGKIVFLINADGIDRLFESDINDVAGHAKLIASEGDTIDINNDGLGDHEIYDFNTDQGVGLDLSEHNYVFTDIDITPLGSTSRLEAIVRFYMDCPELITIKNNAGDINGSVPVYAEADVISASNVISSGANVGYDASTSIHLLSGFEVSDNVLFEARIDGCENLSGPID